MARIELVDVHLHYPGGGIGLDGVSLAVEDGELVAVVGPSGCGKTSLLRVIAGLETPEAGWVRIGDRDMAGVPTEKRDLAMVFQENALLPGRTVGRNVAFPLELRHTPRSEIEDRVGAEARALGIEHYLPDLPGVLSAGHQQLAQTARALVRVPAAFLLDEPLGRLDAQRKLHVRRNLVVLQRGYGVTMIYVTNDPAEAMAVGERIVVIDRGRIEQVAPPRDVYRHPASAFVAEFFGDPPMRLIEAPVVAAGVEVAGRTVPVAAPAVRSRRSVRVGVRPEKLVRAADAPGEPAIPAVVELVEFAGDRYRVYLGIGDHGSLVALWSDPEPVGARIEVALPRAELYVFDVVGGRAVATPL